MGKTTILLPSSIIYQHVRCAVHLRRDIKEKIKEMGVPKQYQSLFIGNVIGSFHSPHVTGLVDVSTSEKFDKILSKLQSIWQKREVEFSSRSPLCINGLLSIMQKMYVTS